MTTYSCLFIGPGSIILKRQTIDAANDQAAMSTAQDLFRQAELQDKPERFELWGSDRRVFAR